MDKFKIQGILGIAKERSSPWERRVPFTPAGL